MKKKLPDNVWIKVQTRDLTNASHGEGRYDLKKDIHYVYDESLGLGQEDNGLDLTKIIYSIIKKYEKLKDDGEVFVFNVTMHHESKFDFSEDGESVYTCKDTEDK